MQLPPTLALIAALVPACGDSTDSSSSRLEPIPATESAIRAVVSTILDQTLTVAGRCSAPHFINCSDGTLGSPFPVDLVLASLTLAPLPSIPHGYTYVAEIHVHTRHEIPVRIGEVACMMELGADPARPSRLVVAGNAVLTEPTEARPYSWVDMTSEMMAGLEPGSTSVTGAAGCDPASFTPQSLSILIGELLPRKLEVCKPAGEPYRLCPLR